MGWNEDWGDNALSRFCAAKTTVASRVAWWLDLSPPSLSRCRGGGGGGYIDCLERETAQRNSWSSRQSDLAEVCAARQRCNTFRPCGYTCLNARAIRWVEGPGVWQWARCPSVVTSSIKLPSA